MDLFIIAVTMLICFIIVHRRDRGRITIMRGKVYDKIVRIEGNEEDLPIGDNRKIISQLILLSEKESEVGDKESLKGLGADFDGNIIGFPFADSKLIDSIERDTSVFKAVLFGGCKVQDIGAWDVSDNKAVSFDDCEVQDSRPDQIEFGLNIYTVQGYDSKLNDIDPIAGDLLLSTDSDKSMVFDGVYWIEVGAPSPIEWREYTLYGFNKARKYVPVLKVRGCFKDSDEVINTLFTSGIDIPITYYVEGKPAHRAVCTQESKALAGYRKDDFHLSREDDNVDIITYATEDVGFSLYIWS